MKVKIEMEEMSHQFNFWPVVPPDAGPGNPSMEISDELWVEYKLVSQRFYALRDQFEQLYRKQSGLMLYASPPIPEHRMLTNDERMDEQVCNL